MAGPPELRLRRDDGGKVRGRDAPLLGLVHQPGDFAAHFLKGVLVGQLSPGIARGERTQPTAHLDQAGIPKVLIHLCDGHRCNAEIGGELAH